MIDGKGKKKNTKMNVEIIGDAGCDFLFKRRNEGNECLIPAQTVEWKAGLFPYGYLGRKERTRDDG